MGIYFELELYLTHLVDVVLLLKIYNISFLDCPIYLQVRTTLIGNLKRGNDNLTYEQNCNMFKYLFDDIKCSKRFIIV